MKWSKYIVEYKKEDSILLFSTLSKAIIELSLNEFSNIDLLTVEQMEYLQKMHFIVEDDFDEAAYVWYIINKDRLNVSTLFTSIMFTENCNFNCSYCYQKSQVEHCNLATQTQDDIVTWIEDKIAKESYKKCNVELYGGEPLLRKNDVFYLAENLHNRISNKVELHFRLITNGYYLDSETVKRLITYGLNDIHITLDGYGETHNKRRPLKSGEGSFDKIIQNLKDITNNIKIPIMIRIGFDNSNLLEIPQLLEYLRDNIDLKNIEIYFAPIYNTTQQVKSKDSFCSINVLKNDELISGYKFLFSETKRLGLPIPKFISSGPCMFWADNSVIFDVHGNIYKCLDMIGIKELVVGNAKNNAYNDMYFKIMNGYGLNSCIKKSCKFVPICGGGCMMQSYTHTNSLETVVCNYDLFDQVNSFLLSLI